MLKFVNYFTKTFDQRKQTFQRNQLSNVDVTSPVNCGHTYKPVSACWCVHGSKMTEATQCMVEHDGWTARKHNAFTDIVGWWRHKNENETHKNFYSRFFGNRLTSPLNSHGASVLSSAGFAKTPYNWKAVWDRIVAVDSSRAISR